MKTRKKTKNQMDDDSVFEANLEIFERFCPLDAKDVKDADCSLYDYCKAESGVLNIKKTTDSGHFYYHSNTHPLREAEAQLSSIDEIDRLDGLVVFGVGLGYFYEACQDWLHEDPKRLLLFIEPDLCLLKMFLQTAQAQNILNDPQVALLSSPEKYYQGDKMLLRYLECVVFLFFNSSFHFSTSPWYVERFEKLWSNIKKLIRLHTQGLIIKHTFYTEEFVVAELENILHNYKKVPFSKLLYGLKDVLKDFPAVICGAGPSLVDDLPELKRSFNRFLLFGAGSGMNALNQHHVLAHMGAGIDPHDTSASRILTNYSYEVPYAFQVRFHYQALEYLHGPLLFFRGADIYGIESWIEKKLGIEDFPTVHSWGSTTHACIGIATLLHCNPIILLGVDLAYTDKKRYPEGVEAHPLDRLTEHYLIRKTSKESFFVRGKNGESVLTKADWVMEGNLYGQVAGKHPETRFINCTSRGLDIPNLLSLSFEEVSRTCFPPACDVENLIHASIQLSPEVSFSKEKVDEIFSQWSQSLQRCTETISAIIEELEKVSVQMGENPDEEPQFPSERQKELEKRLEQEDAYTSFLKGFTDIYEKNLYRKYYRIAYRPETLTPEETLVEKVLLKLGSLLYLLKFLSIADRAMKESKKTVLQEPFDKEVQDLSFKGPSTQVDKGYRFDEKTLKIEDNELGISIQETFCPLLVDSTDSAEERFGFTFARFNGGNPDGQCLWRDPDGWVRAKWYYKNGNLLGPSTFFDRQGNILSLGWFVDGKKQGKNWQYYPSGALYSIKRYRDGELEGRQQFFYENGSLKTELFYKSGKPEGKALLCYPNGKKRREVWFKEGLMHGVEKMWAATGQLILESEYHRNRPVGYSRSWYLHGHLKIEKKYYDEPDQYDLSEWDEEGRLIKKMTFMPKNLGHETLEKEGNVREQINRVKKKLQKLRQDKR